MTVPVWVWALTVGVLVTFLLFDLVVIGRRPHEPTLRECGLAIAVYVGLAVAFGIGVWTIAGPTHGKEFFGGWLTEYSLSVDNLFVFVILMARFAVPRALQQTALMVGIILALVLRGVFIAVGAAAISAFSWVFYIFGAFLVYTAVQLVRSKNDADGQQDNAAMR